jgi:hypothetical protein
MKRLWEGKPNVRGLLRRRDEEAQMFEAGLGDLEHLGTIEALQLLPDTKMEEYDPAPDTDEESTIPVPETFVEAALPRLTPGDVAWVSTFSNNPDYAHLPTNAQGASFRLDASVIEAAIALGKYRPHFTAQGHLIVGIRGALIMTGEEEALQRDSIMLMEQKPDHRTFRCVMAVYHRTEGKVSAFRASTVPNRGGVAACANLLNGHGGRLANLLPTGCYELCVGTHFGKKTTIPTVLRLGRGPRPDTALKVTTLRTKNDGVFGTKDLWDPCRPADNIHPAFSSSTADFSSLGCLTVPGRFSNGRHKGTWAVFREAAGFDDDRHMGVHYDLLLTTGMELAAIAAAPVGSRDDLRRLAHGSVGEEVRALQSALDVTVDGQFGPLTKKRLTERERDVGDGASTGIYSVLSRKKLGFNAFPPMMATSH